MQLQDVQSTKPLVSSNDPETLSVIDENKQIENPKESIDIELFNQLNEQNEQLKTEINKR